MAVEFAAACLEATGGIPWDIEALLREAAEQRMAPDGSEAERVRSIGPSAVARAVLLRLSGMPPEATALVRAVAVLGDGASVSVAAALAEISEPDAARAADLLAGLAILKPAEGLEFEHPIVREAVYADLGPREERWPTRVPPRSCPRRERPRSGSRPSPARPIRRATRSGSRSSAARPPARLPAADRRARSSGCAAPSPSRRRPGPEPVQLRAVRAHREQRVPRAVL